MALFLLYKQLDDTIKKNGIIKKVHHGITTNDMMFQASSTKGVLSSQLK